MAQLLALALGVGPSLRWSRLLGDDSFWFLMMLFISLPTIDPLSSWTADPAESYTLPPPIDLPEW